MNTFEIKFDNRRGYWLWCRSSDMVETNHEPVCPLTVLEAASLIKSGYIDPPSNIRFERVMMDYPPIPPLWEFVQFRSYAYVGSTMGDHVEIVANGSDAKGLVLCLPKTCLPRRRSEDLMLLDPFFGRMPMENLRRYGWWSPRMIVQTPPVPQPEVVLGENRIELDIEVEEPATIERNPMGNFMVTLAAKCGVRYKIQVQASDMWFAAKGVEGTIANHFTFTDDIILPEGDSFQIEEIRRISVKEAFALYQERLSESDPEESVEAIQFALSLDDSMEAMEFLRAWTEGRSSHEWPEFFTLNDPNNWVEPDAQTA